MDGVFKALADPNRRLLLERLNARNGQTLRALCAGLADSGCELTRQAVSKHLALLEAAGLVTAVRRGREKLHYLNPEPIIAIGDRWIHQYDRERARAPADLKTALVTTAMPAAEFVYTTYIKTTPQRVWKALTEPEFTERYWRLSLDSDWEKGSTISWCHDGVTIAHPDQVVLEWVPNERLSYTWHTFSPEWAAAYAIADEQRQAWAAERRSRVTFEIEPAGELVKLTVVHDGFDTGSDVLRGVSTGWPVVVSSLKSLLETGEPLPMPAGA